TVSVRPSGDDTATSLDPTGGTSAASLRPANCLAGATRTTARSSGSLHATTLTACPCQPAPLTVISSWPRTTWKQVATSSWATKNPLPWPASDSKYATCGNVCFAISAEVSSFSSGGKARSFGTSLAGSTGVRGSAVLPEHPNTPHIATY